MLKIGSFNQSPQAQSQPMGLFDKNQSAIDRLHIGFGKSLPNSS
jgi:hypothetical protein